jgi:heme-degrading monooxygenase HmoA
MICRVWHGRTAREKGDAYARFLAQHAIPDYRSVAGNLRVEVMRQDEERVTHFLTVTYWDSEHSIRAFAGDDVLRAKYYPEDKNYLLEFEPTVTHYQVVATAEAH